MIESFPRRGYYRFVGRPVNNAERAIERLVLREFLALGPFSASAT
jgi:hypothetical protein